MIWLMVAFLLLTGCSGMKMEGDCTYARKVETTYVCTPGGKVEHIKIESTQ